MELQRRRPNLLLRQARLRRGWSLQRVADLLNQLEGGPFGVDRIMVYRWEQGIKEVRSFQ